MASVLIVDDEEIVVRILCAALQSAGHEIRVAKSSREALEVTGSVEQLDLIIVDHHVPPERGCDIAERIQRKHPSMKILHVSGYTQDDLEAENSMAPGAGFIQKPFTIRQLREAVSALLPHTARGNDVQSS